MSEPIFFAEFLLSSAQATCRDLGYVVYDLLRDILGSLCASLPQDTKKLEARLRGDIDSEERFRTGEFRSHLKEESPCSHHCLRHLLSSQNESEFCADCVHGREDEAVLRGPPSMEESVAPRKTRASDWEDECYICFASADDSTARLVCCSHCQRAVHKQCIERTYNDIGAAGEEWQCPECVREFSLLQHDKRCVQCEKNDYLFADLNALAEFCLETATAADASTEVADWAVAALEKCFADLKSYHGHIVRDVNQMMFQQHLMSTLGPHGYWTLYDYWAKQPDRRHQTACCEGMANIGVSCSGRGFTYLNPSREIRAQYPDVPWESYPPAPEDGGAEFCRVYRRAW